MSTEQAATAERARAPGRGTGRGIPYSIAYVRSDRWGQLAREAERWALATGQGAKSRGTDVGERIAELQIVEQYFAYPGAAQMEALHDLCAAGDTRAVARLVRYIAGNLSTGGFRRDRRAVDRGPEEDINPADYLPPSISSETEHKPYFEVLSATPLPPSQWEE